MIDPPQPRRGQAKPKQWDDPQQRCNERDDGRDANQQAGHGQKANRSVLPYLVRRKQISGWPGVGTGHKVRKKQRAEGLAKRGLYSFTVLAAAQFAYLRLTVGTGSMNSKLSMSGRSAS